MTSEIQSAMATAQAAPVQLPHAGKTLAQTEKAAKDFEAVFVSQFVGSMFEGIKTDGPFGGGQGEEMFRSMMVEQYGKAVAQQGGFGLASAVTHSLMQHQEAEQRARQQALDAASKTQDAAAASGFSTTRPAIVYPAHPARTQVFQTKPKIIPSFPAHPGFVQ